MDITILKNRKLEEEKKKKKLGEKYMMRYTIVDFQCQPNYIVCSFIYIFWKLWQEGRGLGEITDNKH